MCMVLAKYIYIYIFIYLVKYVCSIITSAPIMVTEVAKLLYHWTYLSPLPSLSMSPQPPPTLSSVSIFLLLSSLAPLCSMSTLLVVQYGTIEKVNHK